MRGALICVALGLAAIAALSKDAVRAPGDIGTLNRFAEAYNRYVAELREGQVDLKQWERVERAWKEVR